MIARNIPALKMLAEAYAARNDTTKRLDVLASLAAADPTNIRLIQDVVAEFAIMKRADKAIPLVRDLLQNNPGDPQLLNLAWKVYLNANDYQGAIDIGNEMVRVDTAAATADYYARTAAAYYGAESSAEVGRGRGDGSPRSSRTTRTLLLFNAQTLLQGWTAPAGAGRSEEIGGRESEEPRPATSCRRRFRSALKQWDDVVNTLNQAKTQRRRSDGIVADRSPAGERSVQGGTGLEGPRRFPARDQVPSAFRSARRLRRTPSSCSAPAHSRLARAPPTMRLERRSCDLARMAREAFTLAEINLPAGGQKYPNEAAQLLTAIPQFTPGRQR